MPTTYGSFDSVAIPSKYAEQLIAAYTFLLKDMILAIWVTTILACVFLSIRKYGREHDSHKVSAAMWSKRSSPFDILLLTVKHFLNPSYSRLIIVFSVFLAVAFFVLEHAIPIVFAPWIILDHAAPVALEAIYVPSLQGINANDPKNLLAYYSLQTPSALRAVGSIDGVNSTFPSNASISIDQPEILEVRKNQDLVMRMGYQYNVTGADLGLQNYWDLVLYVEGSCTTEYGWLSFSNYSQSDPNVYVDQYNVFNDSSKPQLVSREDGPAPEAFFWLGDKVSPSNFTWAMIISSLSRASNYPGNDPLYRTANKSGEYIVYAGRPALSCWQNDVWSYRGQNSTITELNSTALPGLDLSPGLQSTLIQFLGTPKIFTLGVVLGGSALQSASTEVENVFNASSSSMQADLSRLVFASYIATVNTLTDTTLFPQIRGVLNDITTNPQSYGGVGEFVIWSNDVIALSVSALIIIPTITVALWLIFIALIFTPSIGTEVTNLSLKISPDGENPDSGGPRKTRTGLIIESMQPPKESKSEQKIDDLLQTVTSNVDLPSP